MSEKNNNAMEFEKDEILQTERQNSENADLEEKAPQTEKSTEEQKASRAEGSAEEQPKKDEIPDLQAELDALKDKYLRLAAEYDNYKKRTVREKEGISLEVKAKVVGTLLPVVDNLDRAVSMGSDDSVKLWEGLNMILRQVQDCFNTLGVSEIEALNNQFDPNLHDAVTHTEEDGIPENTVTEVFMKGYKVGDKVIRPSMVKVVN